MITDGQPRKLTVNVDDNFNFLDEDERVKYGTFDVYSEAVAACKSIVDACLLKSGKRSAVELLEEYKSFGVDPFISGPTMEPKFSAWDYAEQRSREIAAVKAER